MTVSGGMSTTAFQSSQSRRGGFTLVEIAVTIAIIGIIATLAMPALLDVTVAVDAGPLEPARVLLVQAKKTAERNGSEVEVAIAPTSGRYRITQRWLDGTAESRDGVLRIQGGLSTRADDRFRAVFRGVGVGRGDSLVTRDVVVVVNGLTGDVEVRR